MTRIRRNRRRICSCMEKFSMGTASNHSFLQKLLMRLHDCVGDEGSRDLVSSKPTTVETLHCVLSGIDGVKLDVDLSLKTTVRQCLGKASSEEHTSESLSTLMNSTRPYLSSHSPFTSSARSLSQSRSVSLETRFSGKHRWTYEQTYFSGSNMCFKRTDRDCIC